MQRKCENIKSKTKNNIIEQYHKFHIVYVCLQFTAMHFYKLLDFACDIVAEYRIFKVAKYHTRTTYPINYQHKQILS